MHKLLILSKHADAYRRLVDAARLPDLEATSASTATEALARGRDCDVVLGEPSLISIVLPQLSPTTPQYCPPIGLQLRRFVQLATGVPHTPGT